MATPQEQAAIRQLLQSARNPTIVELGAHCAEDQTWIEAACAEQPHYVMVEADVRNAQVILDKTLLTTHRKLIVGAVAATNGLVEFHVSDNNIGQGRGSGSIRKPTGHLEHIPWCTFPFKTVVPAYTLDEIFRREWLMKIDLLWVDIQGAERDMIAGGRIALSRTHYLFMEAEEIEMYEGQASKAELIAMLPGWTLMQDFGCNILMRRDLPIVEGRIV